MQRIFLTHIVPKDKALEYNISMAGVNFSYNLIGGNAFDKVYSILPSFIHRRIKPFDGLIFSSLRLKGKLAILAPFVENIKLFRLIPSDASIWYYNCTILNVVLIILLKLFKPKVKQQTIILDYTPSKKILNRFLLWLTNKMDGTIRLAESPLFTVKNSVCLPGVVPNIEPDFPKVTCIKKEFLISGALNNTISMLPMLLKVFSSMPEYTLHITGKAPDIKLVKQFTNKYSNIIYHGIVSYEEYLHILHKVPFLLSTRNPSCPENQCNFPSKIIESLLHNRIIISTIHYRQLNDINYFEVPADEEHFKTSIQKIISLPMIKLFTYANQGEKTKQYFNSQIWKETITKIENESH